MTPHVVIRRYGSIPGQGTPGELFTLMNPTFRCKTMEREWLQNQSNISCIPLGENYTCVPFNSPKHGPCYQIQAVPYRDNIEIHVANIQLDLLGCIALGENFDCIVTKNSNGKPYLGVTNSSEIFKQFMEYMNNQTFILSIQRAP